VKRCRPDKGVDAAHTITTVRELHRCMAATVSPSPLLPRWEVGVPDVPNAKPGTISLLAKDDHFLARIADRASRTRRRVGDVIRAAQDGEVGSPIKVDDTEVEARNRRELFELLTDRRPALDERLVRRHLPAVLCILGGQGVPVTCSHDLRELGDQRTESGLVLLRETTRGWRARPAGRDAEQERPEAKCQGSERHFIALIHSPRVLFLDEPLNGIDPISGRVVTDLLRRLAQKGVTMFFTSHVLDVAERLCDEVAIIDRGRLVAQGTLEQIRAQREVGQDATLEDVFLKLVAADVRREDLSWIG